MRRGKFIRKNILFRTRRNVSLTNLCVVAFQVSEYPPADGQDAEEDDDVSVV